MLTRTSLIVAGASPAMMSCAIAGGDPNANVEADTNTLATQTASTEETNTSTGGNKQRILEQ